MKDLNVRQESTKILEENTGGNLFQPQPQQLFPRNITKGKGSKGKNELLGLLQDQKLKKWAEDMNRHFCKEDIQMAKTREKVLHITQHQGNTNQNHKPHTSQNG